MKVCPSPIGQSANRSGGQHRLAPFATLAACVLFSLAGCARSDVGIVTGIVTVDGQPVKNGMIAFFAEDGLAPTTGAQITDGHYRAEVRPGRCRVEIRLQKAPKPLPVKYHDESELSLDVMPGENEQNYDLSTK